MINFWIFCPLFSHRSIFFSTFETLVLYLKSGEKISNTEWHNIVLRNKAAEICEKYLSKGDKVYVEGRIKTRKWQDDKGNDRYSTEIHCTEFTFLSNKGDTPAQADNSNKISETKSQENIVEPANESDDLPF